MMGLPAHVGGRVACPGAQSGPSLVDMVLGPLLPEFHDLCDRIPFCYRGVLPPTLVSYFPLCTSCGDKHISKKKYRAGNNNKIPLIGHFITQSIPNMNF